MPSAQVLPPFESFMDVDGNPLEDGYIYIGADSLDPEANPISAFFDAGLSVPAVQPVRTKGGYPSNSGSPARLYVGPSSYSIRVKNKNSTTVHSDLSISSPTDSSSISFIQNGVGAVERDAQDKMREEVSVEDFGAIGSTGLPVYHPLSDRFGSLAAAQVEYPFVTSLAQSIDWAATQAAANSLEATGGVVKGTKQFYVHTDDVLLPDAVVYRGQGVGFWDVVFPNREKTWGGTSVMLYGTGPKNYSRRGITSMYTAGGRRLISGVDYARLSSLMNEDATDAIPATPKAMSFGFRGKNRISKHWGVEDVRVVPWIGTDGISDYSNQAYTGLAADWSGAICQEDSEYVTLKNVQGVGYFRNYGLLLANSDFDVFGGQERNRVIDCKFQGVRGIAVRSGDVRKVEALTTSTVEILWDAESFWTPTGVFTGFPASVFQQYSYTSLTRNGANLVFNGVTPDPTIQGLTQLRAPCRGSGAAGTIFRDTFAHGLDHTNGGQSESYGLPSSTAFEMSGYPLRGVAFDNFKIQTREKGQYYFHDCQDVLMDQCQAEGSGFRVASPIASASTAPAPSGDTRNMRVSSTLGFASGSLFTPRSIVNEMSQFNGSGLNSGIDIAPWDASQITLSSFTNGEVARVTDNGRFGIGVTAPAQKFHIGTTDPELVRIERTGSSGLVGVQYRNTNGIVSIRVQPSADNAGTFFSSGDNTVSCGTASFRWSTVFAGTGTINTSDGNMKKIRGLMNEAEMRAWGRVNQKIFQMIDSVNEKGEAYARLHAGYIAQEVFDAFAAEGLDAAKYALWCEDAHYKTTIVNQPVLRQKTTTKPKTETSIEIRDGVPVRIVTTTDVEVGEYEQVAVLEEDGSLATDDDGNQIYASVPVMEEVLEDVEVQEPDGVRLGLRYGDCYAFETAYLRTLAHNHELRIAALEGGA